VNRIVPMHHPFVPGGRPSERGMLYRNSSINMHARIAPIQNAQRTWKEGKIFALLMLPDQMFMAWTTLIAGSLACIVYFKTQPFSFNRHKHKWLQGGLNQHEMFQRNHEMSEIMEKHRSEVEATRKAIGGRPAVFNPPEGSSYRAAE